MIETPVVVHTEDQHTATLHLSIPRRDMPKFVGRGRAEVMAAVKAQGQEPIGPWFIHHHTMSPTHFDFDIAVPVTGAITEAGRVHPGLWPAGRVLRTVYHGGYEGLGEAWAQFDSWSHAQGHKMRQDLYECYVTGPESTMDSAAWRTELTRPLAD